MDIELEVIRGGFGRVADRKGRWRNIDSVLAGFRRREFELSHACSDEMHTDILSVQYVEESVHLMYNWRSSA